MTLWEAEYELSPFLFRRNTFLFSKKNNSSWSEDHKLALCAGKCIFTCLYKTASHLFVYSAAGNCLKDCEKAILSLPPRNWTGGFQGHKLQVLTSQAAFSCGVGIVVYYVNLLGSSFWSAQTCDSVLHRLFISDSSISDHLYIKLYEKSVKKALGK